MLKRHKRLTNGFSFGLREIRCKNDASIATKEDLQANEQKDKRTKENVNLIEAKA